MTKLEKIIQNITEDTVKDLYITKDLTREQCAKELNISYNMFNQLLAYYNIHVDKRGGNQIKPGEFSPKFKQILATVKYEDIVEVYLNQKLSLPECASALNICTESFVKLVKHYGLSRDNKPGPKGGNSKLDKVIARVNKEEFVNDYLVNNLRREDMQKKYDIPEIFVFEQLVTYYDCKKDRSSVVKITHEIYAAKSDEEKLAIVNKRKATMASKSEEWVAEYKNKLSTNMLGKNKGNEPWCKGLTKDTDERIKSLASHVSETLKNRANKLKESDPNYFNSWRSQISDSMRANNTFNKSNPEDKYYEYLLTIYPEDDIDRQHKEERYPFACDFYIKSEDLFIECNYSWTHGGHPFDPEDEADQRTLAEWQEKALTSDYYKNAIETWTVRDVAKQKVAKENNLNYEVLY